MPNDRSVPVPTVSQVLAVALGNALEFYDFVTYSFFAIPIGESFFPAGTPAGSLLASLATFGIGFLFRPLGAFLLGRLADRRGRRPALLVSFGLIGLAGLGLALTPPFRTIGAAAPVLAVTFRMLQGFALGGELGPSTAFLVEAAPPRRRGLFTALQAASADFAVLVAGLLGLLLAWVLSPAALAAWGWRIAVLLGVSVVPFGLVLRARLTETLHRSPAAAPRAPAGPRPNGGAVRVAILGGALLASATSVTYTLDYLSTFAVSALRMPARVAFGATVVVGLSGTVADLLGGQLSDRWGRRPLLIVPALLLLLLVFPCFELLRAWRSPGALLASAFLLAFPAALSSVSAIVVIAESLPERDRATGIALIYALAISVFGGIAQFAETALIDLTGNPLMPAWYMSGFVVLGLGASFILRETAPARSRVRPSETAVPAAGLPP